MRKPLIIGIAGGSASGKTSISKTIVKTFNDIKSVQVIKQDDYYKDCRIYINGRIRLEL